VRHGVALRVEPAPASGGMAPLLAMRALRIRAKEEVITPRRVVERMGIPRPRDVRFAAVAEVGFGTRSAPGAADQQHRENLAMPIDPCSTITPACTRARGARTCGARRIALVTFARISMRHRRRAMLVDQCARVE